VRILLTGKDGQVGFELLRALAPLGEVAAFDHAGLDLAAPDQITSAVRSIRPDVIVNAAAYTAVDRAESEPGLANAINASGVSVLAGEAKRAGALLIHYSTDYVFDGTKDSPYVEDDRPNPLNAYGRSKLAGELAARNAGGHHLILRTSWVFASRGRNFFLTIRRLLKEKSELRVVSDQTGAPTSARAIADATAQLLRRHAPNALRAAGGTYHLTAAGHTSWHGFAMEIARLDPRATAGSVRIEPIPSSEYPVAARRPSNSRLSNEKILRTLGIEMPRWEQCLEACYAELAPDRRPAADRTVSG
jgi:dTDP-4-dehydrorhamnose reductase